MWLIQGHSGVIARAQVKGPSQTEVTNTECQPESPLTWDLPSKTKPVLYQAQQEGSSLSHRPGPQLPWVTA